MNPNDINTADYTYDLPEDRIASFPLELRDRSRLLIRDVNGLLSEDVFRNISGYIPAYSTMFSNNSKVIPARLVFPNLQGSQIEIFCLKPLNPSDYQRSLGATEGCTWECMIGNLKKFRDPGLNLAIGTGNDKWLLTAYKKALKGNIAEIEFSWNRNFSFAEVLSLAGLTPLPPYIKREPVSEDRIRYQTVYSKVEGSVAAPTAGLHFTQDVFRSLKERNIQCHEITLHIGAGTFQPVKTDRVKDHKMHDEYFEVDISLVELLAGLKERVTCVGTTTVRTLESLYWIGAKMHTTGAVPESLTLGQWEPYTIGPCTVRDAFEALRRWFMIRKVKKVLASTRFMIIPGYRFRITERMITNFHQPGSTLLLLIAAFIGDAWKETYQFALEHQFRFLSYGDSSLLFNPDGNQDINELR